MLSVFVFGNESMWVEADGRLSLFQLFDQEAEAPKLKRSTLGNEWNIYTLKQFFFPSLRSICPPLSVKERLNVLIN